MSTARTSTDLRLNRRGRFFLHGLPVMILAVLITAAAVFFGSTALTPAAASGDQAPAAVETHLVGYGETLWSIAGEIAPERDRTTTIEQIGAMNSLTDSELQPGQLLYVPQFG